MNKGLIAFLAVAIAVGAVVVINQIDDDDRDGQPNSTGEVITASGDDAASKPDAPPLDELNPRPAGEPAPTDEDAEDEPSGRIATLPSDDEAGSEEGAAEDAVGEDAIAEDTGGASDDATGAADQAMPDQDVADEETGTDEGNPAAVAEAPATDAAEPMLDEPDGGMPSDSADFAEPESTNPTEMADGAGHDAAEDAAAVDGTEPEPADAVAEPNGELSGPLPEDATSAPDIPVAEDAAPTEAADASEAAGAGPDLPDNEAVAADDATAPESDRLPGEEDPAVAPPLEADAAGPDAAGTSAPEDEAVALDQLADIPEDIPAHGTEIPGVDAVAVADEPASDGAGGTSDAPADAPDALPTDESPNDVPPAAAEMEVPDAGDGVPPEELAAIDAPDMDAAEDGSAEGGVAGDEAAEVATADADVPEPYDAAPDEAADALADEALPPVGVSDDPADGVTEPMIEEPETAEGPEADTPVSPVDAPEEIASADVEAPDAVDPSVEDTAEAGPESEPAEPTIGAEADNIADAAAPHLPEADAVEDGTVAETEPPATDTDIGAEIPADEAAAQAVPDAEADAAESDFAAADEPYGADEETPNAQASVAPPADVPAETTGEATEDTVAEADLPGEGEADERPADADASPPAQAPDAHADETDDVDIAAAIAGLAPDTARPAPVTGGAFDAIDPGLAAIDDSIGGMIESLGPDEPAAADETDGSGDAAGIGDIALFEEGDAAAPDAVGTHPPALNDGAANDGAEETEEGPSVDIPGINGAALPPPPDYDADASAPGAEASDAAPDDAESPEMASAEASADTDPDAGIEADAADPGRTVGPGGADEETGPTFDVIRVSGDGAMILAGKAEPLAIIVIMDGDKVLGEEVSDVRGDWIFMPDEPLDAGNHHIGAVHHRPNGTTAQSSNLVLVVVPERGTDIAGRESEQADEPLVMLVARDGGPATVVVQAPEPDMPTDAESPDVADTSGDEEDGPSVVFSRPSLPDANEVEDAAGPGRTADNDVDGESAPDEGAGVADAVDETVEPIGDVALADEGTLDSPFVPDANTGGDPGAAPDEAEEPEGPVTFTRPSTADPERDEAAADEGAAPEGAPSEDAPAEVATAEGADAGDAQPPSEISIDIIDYDEEGEVSFAGGAPAGAMVQVYLDNTVLGATEAAPSGAWQLQPVEAVPAGQHRIRVDQIAPDGDVIARIELPFVRAEPITDLPENDFVVVQPGQSLWLIARSAYGEGIRYTEILAANKAQIMDPNLIFPGQVFIIPNG